MGYDFGLDGLKWDGVGWDGMGRGAINSRTTGWGGKLIAILAANAITRRTINGEGHYTEFVEM